MYPIRVFSRQPCVREDAKLVSDYSRIYALSSSGTTRDVFISTGGVPIREQKWRIRFAKVSRGSVDALYGWITNRRTVFEYIYRYTYDALSGSPKKTTFLFNATVQDVAARLEWRAGVNATLRVTNKFEVPVPDRFWSVCEPPLWTFDLAVDGKHTRSDKGPLNRTVTVPFTTVTKSAKRREKFFSLHGYKQRRLTRRRHF